MIYSVKKLNNSIVSYLIEEGVNAVGISPCMNIPGLMTHGGNEYNGVTLLVYAIRETLSAGLVPVIHGDAGLYGTYHNRNNDGDGSSIDNDNIMFQHQSMSGGILGGDTLVEIIATHPLMNECISKTIFLTDVPGVYTKDPNIYHDDAMLVRNIDIDPITGKVMNEDIVSASGSLHEHDVTGGLEVRYSSIYCNSFRSSFFLKLPHSTIWILSTLLIIYLFICCCSLNLQLTK
jgi:isopentenyl phosphate kinase